MIERVEINPDVMQGKPVIRGTRVPVELLLRKLAEGATITDLLDAYPRLCADDIRAALAYAADTIAHEAVLALGSQYIQPMRFLERRMLRFRRGSISPCRRP